LTFYSILILKLGRVVLPKHLDFGEVSREWWPAFLLLSLVNPVLEEWYWRLFLPKVLAAATEDHQADLLQGTATKYLLPTVALRAFQSFSRLLAVSAVGRYIQQCGS